MIKKHFSLKFLLTILTAVATLSGVLVFCVSVFQNPVVSFSDGSSILYTVEVKKGETVSPIEDPIKEEYDFIGWYLNDKEYDFNSPVKEDITLNALFKEKQYVTFMVDNEPWQKIVIKNGKIIMPTEPDKEGYRFVRWVKEGQEFDGHADILESCEVYAEFVKYVKLTSLKFGKDSYTVEAGSHFLTEIIGKPDNWVENITFSSTDESVVRIDHSGKVTGIKAGKAKIIAVSESGKKASAIVNVIIYPTDITAEEVIGIDHGSIQKLNVKFTPENATETSLTYISDNENIISVDKEGNLKAVGFGEALIRVTTTNGISKEIKVYSNGCFITAEINNIKPKTEMIRLYNTSYGKVVFNVSIMLHCYNMDVVSISSIDGSRAVMKGADNYLFYNPADSEYDGEPTLCATEYASGDKMPYSRKEKIWFEYTDDNNISYSTDVFDIMIEAEIRTSCTTADTAEIIGDTIYVRSKEESISTVFAIEVNHDCTVRTDSNTMLLNSRVVTGKKGITYYYYTFSFTRGANVVGSIILITEGGQQFKFNVVTSQ